MPPAIEHVIVLMMENRSFDHMLGFLDHPDPAFPRLTREDGIGKTLATSSAWYEIDSPDHSHEGVMGQLFGGEGFPKEWRVTKPYPDQGTNRGFVRSYFHRTGTQPKAEAIMRCFHPKLIPVLSGLAKEYAVCTRWFCSVPGETWPNRDFAVAARSFGRVNQHYRLRRTPHTIFGRLDAAGASWRIYHDSVAHTWLYPSLYGRGAFANMSRLLDDIEAEVLPRYSFIEPDYGIGTDNRFARRLGITALIGDTYGNSHHPGQAGSGAEFLAGEHLIAGIYNALVDTMKRHPADPEKSLFAKTLFVLTYDEHGGFYDRIMPPPAAQPTDEDVTGGGFTFDILGPRVPAILISPWIPRGRLVDTVFDHSSIPATVRRLFAPGQPALTRRDLDANTFEGVLGDRLRTPDSADPILRMTALSRAEAEEMAELYAASPNPAERVAPDTSFRDHWLEAARMANEERRARGLASLPAAPVGGAMKSITRGGDLVQVAATEDAFVRGVVDLMQDG